MLRLKKRAEFLAVAKGVRSARRAFVLQALVYRGAEEPARIGFTVTRKAGSAVERNRIRRRLREAVRLADPGLARPGADYVLVGRREALSLDFAALAADLASAFRQVHREPRAGPRTGAGKHAGASSRAGTDQDAGVGKDAGAGAGAGAGQDAGAARTRRPPAAETRPAAPDTSLGDTR